jgi:16S rRNA (guanine527-N7)-methyltransferase
MIDDSKVQGLLEPFGIRLTSRQMSQMLAYLSLLLNWNQKINLTAVRTAEDCVTRHFGESFLIGRFEELKGKMLDIGSGAGFPGLALKITFPDLRVTLLEPVAKKRAFLKEVVRLCDMQNVEVRPDRLEEYAQSIVEAPFDLATCRAVGGLGDLIPRAVKCVRVGGRIFLWLGSGQQRELVREFSATGEDVRGQIEWQRVAQIPFSKNREIWRGDVLSS